VKIAVASSGLGHVARGMESWAESLAAALHERGVDVTLFRGAGPAKNEYDIVLPCIKRTDHLAKIGNALNKVGGWRIGLGSEASVESFSFGMQLLWRLRKGYDIVHVQQGSLALFMDRARKLGLLKCPIVLGNGQKAPLDFLRRFEYVHFLSPFGMQEILGDRDKPPRWQVIPNFVDTDVFCPGDQRAARKQFGFPEDAFVVLSVGMVDKQVKRMDYFIREAAVEASGEQKMHFVIAGSRHPESEEIEKLGNELLGSNLKILYNVKRERMPDLYRAADIFVLCSPREALGLALLEAMSCGLAAICHSFPTMQWVLGAGGMCLDMTKSNGLHPALMRLREDKCMRERLGQTARKRVVEHFSKEAVISSLVELYRDVVSERKAPGLSKQAAKDCAALREEHFNS
jgi:glycosyltransferase involved in cell wall biosynthesis